MWFSFLCQGLNLLDSNLTTARLMGIITSERLDPSNLTCCLDEEVLMCLHQLVVHAQLLFSFLLLNLFSVTDCGVDYIPGIFRSAIRMC